MSNRAITTLVLGMHRSGTSLLAEALHAGGMSLAGQLVEDNKEVNARGFWEDAQVVQINEQLFHILHSSWYDIGDLPHNWLNQKPVQEQLSSAISYIEEQYGNKDLAVLKDPRLCRLLPFWVAAFRAADIELRCVIITRSPSAVAKSLLRRNSLPQSYSHLLWARYMKDAVHFSKGMTRCLVDYDALLESPAEVLVSVFRQLKLESPDWGNNLETIVDSSLRHHFNEADVSAEDELSARVRDYYLRLGKGDFSSAEEPENLLPNWATIALVDLANTVVSNYSEQIRAGDLHSQSLKTVAQRDREIEHLTELYQHAESVVRERDLQLSELIHSLRSNLLGKLALRWVAARKKD